MIQLIGEDRKQAKQDAQNITIGEARSMCNAMLNDFVANHLTQLMVPVVEHYMAQIPQLVEAQLTAREAAIQQASQEATVERIMSAIEAEAKRGATILDGPPVMDTLGDPDE